MTSSDTVSAIVGKVVASNKFNLRLRWEIGRLIIAECGVPERPGKGGKMEAFLGRLSVAAFKKTGSPYAPAWFYRCYQAARFIPGDYLEAVINCLPTWEHLRILFGMDDKARAETMDEMAVTGKIPKRLFTSCHGGGVRKSSRYNDGGMLDRGIEVDRPDAIVIEPWPEDDWEPLQIKFEALMTRHRDRLYQIEQAFNAALRRVKR